PRYVPESMFNAGLDFHSGPFKASAVTHYIAKVYNDNLNSTVNWNVYGVQDKVNFVTDLSAGVDFLNHFNFTVSVNNLFDSEYYQYSKAQGRTVFGILTMKFN
ncbi:MAG: TonB-dependent receptor, partial [Nitrospirales bacterium]|nr:TonB-dependent receptor [Nitrospirales bacterium]